MKIIFMGTPAFAVPCLQRLLDDGHSILAVYTQPDKPAGRGMKLQPSPVKQLALQQNIPLHQPPKLRGDPQIAATIATLAPDLLVVVAYGKILPPDILAIPTMGCINVHGSLLPKYRGAAPIQHAVLNGDAITGVTTMYMAEGMDTGDMILTKEYPISQNQTTGQVFEALSLLGAACLSDTVAQIAAGTAPRIPQNHVQATHAPMIEKSMGALDFTKPAAALHNCVRGMAPSPGAYTHFRGKRLKVLQSCVATATPPPKTAPGAFLGGSTLQIACGAGTVLQLLQVQPEGKPALSGDDFLRGYRLTQGELLQTI